MGQPVLRVLSPGLWSTLQDRGRRRYRSLGVPVGGAFDQGAHALANALLGNSVDAPTLEMTLIGTTFEALAPVAGALAGARMAARVELSHGAAVLLRTPQCFSLKAGDRLVLGRCAAGARTYLALRNGFHATTSLGSASCEIPLRTGDVLLGEPRRVATRWPDADIAAPFQSATEAGIPSRLHVLEGPDAAASALAGRRFRVGSSSDRAGLRLEPANDAAPSHHAGLADRFSAPVCPGAVQATQAGLIILGVACGTMGGYPHISTVIDADLDRLGQLRSGDQVEFWPISLDEASSLRHELQCRRLRHELLLRTIAGDLL